ncbi:hypothetical protein [uncultured Veillonella sp.]|uniref:hypothetical protein n=1 Tax=uncultured Veillonella sp. TaxID=159268 RepID=UPI0028E3E46B|nr:hypothetical protein [uncultured Veillonella sp.]
MDSKQIIRHIIKLVGFFYWFIFLYLGGQMLGSWSDFMTRYNIETPIFLTFIVVIGCIVTPYLVFYWKKLNPNTKPPYLVRCLSAYMDRLEDQHSIWFDVLYVLKLLLYFVTIMWMICVGLLTLAIIAWTIVLILLSH